jgi:hypothetical protein
VISYLFSFNPNRGQLAAVDLYSQGFSLCVNYFPNTAALTVWAAPQIAIHRRSKQPPKYPPKKANDKQSYDTDGKQIY